MSRAPARVQPIAVGKSFEDRGMRNDQHDAVAIVLNLHTTSQPTMLIAQNFTGNDVSITERVNVRDASQLAIIQDPQHELLDENDFDLQRPLQPTTCKSTRGLSVCENE